MAFAAVAMIIAGAVWGYSLGSDYDHYGRLMDPGKITLLQLVTTALGLSLGLGVASAVFGIAAAIFDMQESLRYLSEVPRARDRLETRQSARDLRDRKRREEPHVSR
jgi:hypothetical protein